jgi:hypothetical protein
MTTNDDLCDLIYFLFFLIVSTNLTFSRFDSISSILFGDVAVFLASYRAGNQSIRILIPDPFNRLARLLFRPDRPIRRRSPESKSRRVPADPPTCR